LVEQLWFVDPEGIFGDFDLGMSRTSIGCAVDCDKWKVFSNTGKKTACTTHPLKMNISCDDDGHCL